MRTKLPGTLTGSTLPSLMRPSVFAGLGTLASEKLGALLLAKEMPFERLGPVGRRPGLGFLEITGDLRFKVRIGQGRRRRRRYDRFVDARLRKNQQLSGQVE